MLFALRYDFSCSIRRMCIRRTQTRNRASGEPYVTYRLVHSARVGSAIKQTT